MAFKDRISGMFRMRGKDRGDADASDDAEADAGSDRERHSVTVPEPASAEERQELLQELGRGFVKVGDAIEHLDEHLDAGTRALQSMQATQERLPAFLDEHQRLIREVAATAATSRQALEQLGTHLAQRDQVQTALVERLEQLARGVADQRDTQQRQIEMVLGFHRSGRLVTILLMLGGFALIVLLLAALLLVVLRPDAFGLRDAPPSATGSTATGASDDALLREAAASGDPAIAATARRLLDR